jgi:hypothetical protein
MNHTSTAQESLGYLARRTPKTLLFDNASPSAGTYTNIVEMSQTDIAISIVGTLGSSSSVSVSVYPVDPKGNVLNSAPLFTAVSLSATGNVYSTGNLSAFRSVQVSIVVTGTVSGLYLTVYG